MHRISSFLLLALLSIVLLGFPGSARAAGVIYDIGGTWDSTFGPMTLKMDGKDDAGEVVVTGTWQNGENQGQIVYGRLNPNKGSGLLSLEYYMPWRKMYGFAEMAVKPAENKIVGRYFEAGQSGDWTLTRKTGNLALLRGELPHARGPLTKRGSKNFQVLGKWDSTFGEVNLEGTTLGAVIGFKGTFKRQDGKLGQIKKGSFMKNPSGGFMKLEYFAPWNKTSGEAIFRPDTHVGGDMLVGSYTEGSQSGVWILSRPLAYKLSQK